MLVESVNGSVKNVAPPVQVDLPVAEKPVSKGREGPVAENKSDVSDLSNLVADAQRSLNVMHDMNLNFSVHETSGQTIITVTDETTGDVVREIPAREMLNLAVKLDEMVGLIFDQKI